MRNILRAILVLAGIAGVSGCSDQGDRKAVIPVGGVAVFKGEPMAGARITFHPLNDPDPRGVRATGTAGADGRFALTTYVTGDGAPAGEYAVTIYWPAQGPKKPKGKAEPGEDEDIRPDRLRRAHADAKTTKLRATVREQPNTIDFTLPK
jgi:hypothetical protein